MAEGISNFMAKEAGDEWFLGNAYSFPDPTYLALLTSAAGDGDDGSSMSEVTYTSGTAYARQSMAQGSGVWSVSSAGVVTNDGASGEVTFPKKSSTGTVTATHWALMDSATLGAGEILFHGSITTPSGGLAISQNITPIVEAGALTIDLNNN